MRKHRFIKIAWGSLAGKKILTGLGIEELEISSANKVRIVADKNKLPIKLINCELFFQVYGQFILKEVGGGYG